MSNLALRPRSSLKLANRTRPLHSRHNAWHGKSAYARIPHDAYFTRDERCMPVLLRNVRLRGRVWDPACGDFHMVRQLRAAGIKDVVASDILRYGPGRMFKADFLRVDEAPEGVASIVTNPPNHLSVLFAMHALKLMRARRGIVAFLVPLGWDAVPERMTSFGVPLRFRLTLGFRPVWFERGPLSCRPREDWVWLVWDFRHRGPQEVRYA